MPPGKAGRHERRAAAQRMKMTLTEQTYELDPQQFVVQDALNFGAQGAVYLALHADRPCVLKISRHPTFDVRDEAQANQQILDLAGPHRNIARYRGTATLPIDGQPRSCLVFDRVDGKGGRGFQAYLNDAVKNGRLSGAQRTAIA